MSLAKWKGVDRHLFWDTKSKKFSIRDDAFNEANMLRKEVNELTLREDWVLKWTISVELEEMQSPTSQTQDEENQEASISVMLKEDIYSIRKKNHWQKVESPIRPQSILTPTNS